MFIRWIRVRHTCTVLKLSHITKLGKIDFSEMSSNLTQEGSWSKKTLLAREYFIFISNLKRAVLVAQDGLKFILNSNFIFNEFNKSLKLGPYEFLEASVYDGTTKRPFENAL